MRNPKGVIAYLVLAFGLAWVGWEIPIRMGIQPTSPQFQLYALPGAFAPALAAVLVRIFGREGFGDAGLKLPLRRWPYFAFALLLPLAVVAAITLEATKLGLGQPDLTLASAIKGLTGRALPANAPPYLGLLVIPQMLVTAVLVTPILWGEEFGWRGYLQPRLLPGRPLASAAVTGAIWGAWHWPLIFRGYDFGEQTWAGAAVILGSCVLLSFIFAWLVERTGSIWASSLAHSATNVIGGGLTLLWFYDLKNPLMTSYIGVMAWPPFILLCLVILVFGRRRASGPAQSDAGSATVR